MASNGATVFKNLGKSVTYSSLEVLSKLAPNTSELVRGAKSGADATRDFIRDNQTKMRNTGMQYDRTTVAKKASAFLKDAWKDVKQGNLSLGDLADQSFEDWENYGYDGNEDYYSSQKEEEGDEDDGKREVSQNLGADYRTLEGMKQMTSTLSSTSLKATEYQTRQLTNAIFTQMASQNQHFLTIEKQLDSINKNLVQLVKFQGDNQAVINKANLTFYDQISRYMEKQENRQAELSKRSLKGNRNKAESFLAGNAFDLDSYKEMVKGNIESSPLGQLYAMSTALDPSMIKMGLAGSGGKIQPQKFLLNAILKLAIPASTRRAINRGDSQINTMVKTMLSRLGSYKYDLGNHPILGTLGSLLGIDTRLNRSLRMDQYKRGDMSWNGEAQKALTTIIPKELAEIKAAITGRDARYYDYETGAYSTAKQVRDRVKYKYEGAVEQSFVNIYNRASLSPDDKLNKKYWDSMTDEAKDQISSLVTEAVHSTAGMTTEITNDIHNIFEEYVKEAGGSFADVRRMMGLLTDAVNEARLRGSEAIQDLQSSSSAFTQVAADMTDKYGRISYEDFRKYIDYAGVNLKKTNGDDYTRTGKRKSSLSKEELELEQQAEDLYDKSLGRFYGMKNSSNKVVRTAGKVAEKVVGWATGTNVGSYGKRPTKAVEDTMDNIYRVTMLGRQPMRARRYGKNKLLALPPGADIDPSKIAIPLGGDLLDEGVNPQDEGVPVIDLGDETTAAALQQAAINASEQPKESTEEAPEGKKGKNGRPKRIKLKGVTTSASQRQDQEEAGDGKAQSVQIMSGNKAYGESVKDEDPQERTAAAAEQMSDNVEKAMGVKGWLTKIFKSDDLQNLIKKFKETKAGKKVGEWGDKAKAEFKKIFTNKDADGKEQNSVLGNLQDIGHRYKAMVFKTLGINIETDEVNTQDENTVTGAAAQAAQTIEETTKEITGSTNAKEAKAKAEKSGKGIMDSLKKALSKYAPKVATGAVLGGIAGASMGGSAGILGKLFLPGGPIGGAIVGSAVSMLTQTEAFQSMLFGKKNEAGDREGGLISKKMQDGFKKALPTLGIGAGAGIVLKMLGKTFGINGGPLGVVTGAFLPGGIMGAAIMGSAGAFMLKNQKVQDILFGEKDEDGKRSGAFLSNAYNKLTGKIKSAQSQKGGKRSIPKKLLDAVKGAGVGAISGAALSKMGLLGSTLSFGGPIGTAIAGAAIGIAATGDKFNDYVFGTKDKDGKRNKDGLLSRLGTSIELNLIEPAKLWMKNTAVEFAWWVKKKVEVPFRMAFGPIVDAFKDLKKKMSDAAVGTIKKSGEFVGKKIENILLKPVGRALMNFILKPIGKEMGALFKGALFGGATLVGAPFRLLSLITSPTRLKGENKFSKFLRGNKEDNLQQYWANQEAAGTGRTVAQKGLDRLYYGAASMPVVGSLFRSNKMIGDMADMYTESPEGEGLNTLDWLGARADKKQYGKELDNARDEAKLEKKKLKLRQKWAKQSNNVNGYVDPETFAKRKAFLKDRYNIDIETQEDLRKFTFDYDAWKKPGDDKASTEENIQSDVNTGFDAVTNLLTDLGQKVEGVKDVVKAIFDTQTGSTVDTSDMEPGESLAEDIDDRKAEEIQQNQAKRTAQALGDQLAAQNEKSKKDEETAKIRGNTSGQADDDDNDTEEGYASQIPETTEEKQSFLSTLLGGASSLFSTIASHPLLATGIGLLLASLLSNEDVQSAIATIIKKVIPGVADEIGEQVTKVLGDDGGVNNQRSIENSELTERNEDGTTTTTTVSTKSSLNTGLVEGVGNVLRTGGIKQGKKIATQVAAVAAEDVTNANVLSKVIIFIKKVVKSAIEKKVAKKAAATMVEETVEHIDDVGEALGKVTLSGEAESKLAGAAAQAGVCEASYATPLAIINAIIVAAETLDGIIAPQSLFQVDENAVNSKMRVVSGIFKFIESATFTGALLEVVSEIAEEYLGFNFVRSLAVIMFNVLATKEEEIELDDAVKAFEEQVEAYNKTNNTELTTNSYNDLSNKGVLSKAWNSYKNSLGLGDFDDYDKYEEDSYDENTTLGSPSQSIVNSYYSGGMTNLGSSALSGGMASSLGSISNDVLSAIMGAENYEDYQEQTLTNLMKYLPDSVVASWAALQGSSTRAKYISMKEQEAVANGKYTDCVVARDTEVYKKNFWGKLKSDGTIVAGSKVSILSELSTISGTEYGYVTGYTIPAYTNTKGKAVSADGCYIKASDLTISSSSGYGGRGNVGHGPGLQGDPHWANMAIGRFPNGKVSTMATGGCGPTALSNAANMLGLGTTPAGVASLAMDNGYIVDGGASADLFDRGANQLGLSSTRLNGADDIAASLQSGNPVIMSGQNSSGYGSNPYTGAGHIVTATGMDKAGNVTVEDPMKGTSSYKLSDLQRNMTGAWSIGRGAQGYGILSSILNEGLTSLFSGAYDLFGATYDGSNENATYGFSNGRTTGGGGRTSGSSDTTSTSTGDFDASTLENNTEASEIWNYLTNQAGLTKYAAAGVMGCWNSESSNKAARVEGDYLKSFPGVNSVLRTNDTMDSYTTNTLFKAYDNNDPPISYKASAYMSGGHYYPGVGLAQWTGSRGQKLFDYSRSNNMSWGGTATQLAFADKEMTDSDLKSYFNRAGSAGDAAQRVLDKYEMCTDNFGQTHPSFLSPRADAAHKIYNYYNHKSNTTDDTATDPTSVGNGTGAKGYGILESILGESYNSLVDGAYSLFGATNDGEYNVGSTSDSTTDTSDDSTSDGSSYLYTPREDVDPKQNALVEKMNSIYGTLTYSLDSPQDPDQGQASCASTVAWAYRKVLDVNPGGDSGYANSNSQSKDTRFTTIYTNTGDGTVDLSTLQPGDIMYQNWSRTSYNGDLKHTEMYTGDGKHDLSHGNPGVLGPTSKDLNSYRLKHTMLVRRYNGFMDAADDSASESLGNGPGYDGAFSVGNVGQYTHRNDLRSYGYGTGSESTTKPVETRLDTIIGVLKGILSATSNSGKATASTSYTTVNYGAGDKVNKATNVIVAPSSERKIGAQDSSNNYLRTKHRTLAAAYHA